MFSVSTVAKALLVLALGAGAYFGGLIDLSTEVKNLNSRLEAGVEQEMEGNTSFSPHVSAGGGAKAEVGAEVNDALESGAPTTAVESEAEISAEADGSVEAESGEQAQAESGVEVELEAGLDGSLETGTVGGDASDQGDAGIQLGAGLGSGD